MIDGFVGSTIGDRIRSPFASEGHGDILVAQLGVMHDEVTHYVSILSKDVMALESWSLEEIPSGPLGKSFPANKGLPHQCTGDLDFRSVYPKLHGQALVSAVVVLGLWITGIMPHSPCLGKCH